MIKKALLSFLIIFSGLILCSCRGNSEDTLLLSSQSPSGKYILNAYKTEPNATVDFSVKVYLVRADKQKLIYNAYHEREVDIIWLDDERVSINGRVLDLSIGETFDWRKDL